MKRDIESREDITLFIYEFYGKVKVDPVIGFIFNEVAKMNWETHIPLIVDFWETILLDNPVYKKNAMEVHYDLNKKLPLQKEHFDTWLFLFNSTVDELFEGSIVTLAKTRAKAIADLMFFKINDTNNKRSLL
ncbi:MAG: group III truncated hemoglobin [Ferruginibacter sp.]